MSRQFEDARYYLERAGETTGKGLTEELEPVEARFRETSPGARKNPNRADWRP